VLAVQAAGGWSLPWAPLAAAMVAWWLCTHAREGRWQAFKAELKAVGNFSCAPRQQGHGMGSGAMLAYGDAQLAGRRGACTAARRVVARERAGRVGSHRRVPLRADRWALAGVNVRA
jgi:hypothetical protein